MMPREQPQKYIPGVQTSALSLNQWRPTYLADPRDRLKSSKPAPKDRRSKALELKHAACKGTAATLGNKAATIGALAQAVADAISDDQPKHESSNHPRWSAKTREQTVLCNDQHEATKHMEPLPTHGHARILRNTREETAGQHCLEVNFAKITFSHIYLPWSMLLETR